MKELDNLKELYLDEIKNIYKKGTLTPADSEAANKALDSLEKIRSLCEKEEAKQYSEAMYRNRSMMPEMSQSMRAYSTPYYHNDVYRGQSMGYSMAEPMGQMSRNGYSMSEPMEQMSRNGYSMGEPMEQMSRGGYSMMDGYEDYSERRGRNRLGQYTSRRDEETARYMVDILEELRKEAPNRKTARAIDLCIDKIDPR